MKMSKFVEMCIGDLEQPKFTVSEYKEFCRTHDIYETLKSFRKDITAEHFVETMLDKKFCVKDIQTSYECMTTYNPEFCKSCWKDYLARELRPLRRTSFFEVIRGEKGKEMVAKVKSKEYAEWVYDALNRGNGSINGELVMYAKDETDKTNGALLSIFMMYIGDLVSETDVENLANGKQWETEKYFIKLKDKYIEISEVFGQGSVVFIQELKEKPANYLDLP